MAKKTKRIKKAFKVSGKMSVGRFEKEFEVIFGVKCDILSKGELASNDARIASLRSKSFKGPRTVDFSTLRDDALELRGCLHVCQWVLPCWYSCFDY